MGAQVLDDLHETTRALRRDRPVDVFVTEVQRTYAVYRQGAPDEDLEVLDDMIDRISRQERAKAEQSLKRKLLRRSQPDQGLARSRHLCLRATKPNPVSSPPCLPALPSAPAPLLAEMRMRILMTMMMISLLFLTRWFRRLFSRLHPSWMSKGVARGERSGGL